MKITVVIFKSQHNRFTGLNATQCKWPKLLPSELKFKKRFLHDGWSHYQPYHKIQDQLNIALKQAKHSELLLSLKITPCLKHKFAMLSGMSEKVVVSLSHITSWIQGLLCYAQFKTIYRKTDWGAFWIHHHIPCRHFFSFKKHLMRKVKFLTT